MPGNFCPLSCVAEGLQAWYGASLGPGVTGIWGCDRDLEHPPSGVGPRLSKSWFEFPSSAAVLIPRGRRRGAWLDSRVDNDTLLLQMHEVSLPSSLVSRGGWQGGCARCFDILG